MFGNKHRGWEQKQDGSRSRALQDGLHAEVATPGQRVDTTFGFFRDKVEGSKSTDTDEYWEYGMPKTDEIKGSTSTEVRLGGEHSTRGYPT